MDVNNFGPLQTVAIYALPVLFAITLHEAAHGYVARHFGDMTAYAQGRVSLNPLRHVDVRGTIIVPLALILLSGGKFTFGWAKPVPVNYSALRKPKEQMAWVAAAGPAANFLMTIAWALLFKTVIELPRGSYSAALAQMAIGGIVVNLVIMVMNLLPILPLDGGRILVGLLPRQMARQYARSERWGGFVLLIFIVVSLIDAWIYDGRYFGAVFAPLSALIAKVIHTVVAL